MQVKHNINLSIIDLLIYKDTAQLSCKINLTRIHKVDADMSFWEGRCWNFPV